MNLDEIIKQEFNITTVDELIADVSALDDTAKALLPSASILNKLIPNMRQLHEDMRIAEIPTALLDRFSLYLDFLELLIKNIYDSAEYEQIVLEHLEKLLRNQIGADSNGNG